MKNRPMNKCSGFHPETPTVTDESSDDQLSPQSAIYRRGKPEGGLGPKAERRNRHLGGEAPAGGRAYRAPGNCTLSSPR